MASRVSRRGVVALATLACRPCRLPGIADRSSPSEPASPAASASAEPRAAPSVGRHRLARDRPCRPAPAAREDHTWTVGRRRRGRVPVRRPRREPRIFDDLWAYDLATDTWPRSAGRRTAAGRFGHNAAWVAGRRAGRSSPARARDGFFNDLWAFDPATTHGASSPQPARCPCRATAAARHIGPDGRLWISHGFTSEGQRSPTPGPTTSRPRPGPMRRPSATRRSSAACTAAGGPMTTAHPVRRADDRHACARRPVAR